MRLELLKRNGLSGPVHLDCWRLILPCHRAFPLQDEQRLELLKEIGGTRVYEDRRCVGGAGLEWGGMGWSGVEWGGGGTALLHACITCCLAVMGCSHSCPAQS